MSSLVVQPIGFVRSPFREKADAPRQATVGRDVVGQVELLPEYVDGLSDLEGFDRIWLLFWFDRAQGFRLKVLPPRSTQKRGVFATRSPHRPNPIGMSAVRLDRIEDAVLHIRDLDLLDGTPVLDIKPYIHYADSFPDAAAGWLDAPPAKDDAGESRREWLVRWTPEAEDAVRWVAEQTGLDLRTRIESSLALGPQAHAYRRIKGDVLAVKEWRARFETDASARSILVVAIASGYRPAELARGADPVHAIHRAFVARHRGAV